MSPLCTDCEIYWTSTSRLSIRLRARASMGLPLSKKGGVEAFLNRGYLRRTVIWEHFEGRSGKMANFEPEAPTPGYIEACVNFHMTTRVDPEVIVLWEATSNSSIHHSDRR